MTVSLYARESPRPAALMRIGLGLVLLWDAAGRWPHVIELYSADGLPMPLFPGTAFVPPALPATWAMAVYAVLLYSLAGVALGWKTRLSLAIACVLSAWLGLLDAAGTFKKYSVIGLHLLALLAFTQSHAVWSLDAWFGRSGKEPRDFPKSLGSGCGAFVRLSPRWPRFLARVMISSIYLGAVVTKLRLPDFANGDVLMFSLLDERWGGGRLGMWLATQPRLLVLASFATILFELSAALLLWVPQTRRMMLLLAFGFHASIGIAMHVGIFSPMMVVALLAFVRESDLQAVRRWFRSDPRDLRKSLGSRRHPASVSWLLFLGTGGVWTAFVCVQQSASETLAAKRWESVDDSLATEILVSRPPRVEDYFHRMDVGSRPGYRQVFGEREVFPRGGTVYIIVRTAMPRTKPIPLQWVLRDSAGKEWQRHSRTLDPAYSYVSFEFQTQRPPLPAGEYEILLEADGRVAIRRTIRLRE